MLDNLDSLLNRTNMKIDALTTKVIEQPNKDLSKEVKAMITLLASTNKTLSKAFEAKTLPEFDQANVRNILETVGQFKRTAPVKEKENTLVKVLSEFQSHLKNLDKMSREPLLVKHLKQLDEHLSQLSSQKSIPAEKFQEAMKLVRKANLELQKTENPLMHPKQLPSQSQQTVKIILDQLSRLPLLKGQQEQVGAYKVQTSQKKHLKELKELEELLRVLNLLQKTRGKQAALIEKQTK